jgi:Helix-turn-helix domain of resolvase
MPRKRDLNREAQIQHSLYEQGVPKAEIARKLNVSPPTVSRVVGPSPGQWATAEIRRRIEMIELEASSLAECAFWSSKISIPWGQSLGQKIRSILSRWPTPQVQDLYRNEKLELHTGYISEPRR